MTENARETLIVWLKVGSGYKKSTIINEQLFLRMKTYTFSD